MSATLSFISGDRATMAGTDIHGRGFVAEISRGEVLGLLAQAVHALREMDRPLLDRATTDDPPADAIGRADE